MKLPKRISDILNRKQEFIDSQRDRLSNIVVRNQARLFSDIISDMIPELDVVDGLIVESSKNFRMISLLDKTYKDFNKMSGAVMAREIALMTTKIARQNELYYKTFTEVLNFDKILSRSKNLIDLKIGLRGDKVFKGGWLDSFFNSGNLGTELKQITSQAVTSGLSKKEYIKILKDKITGTKEYTGALERQFNMYAYDLYQQYDAAYNLTIGNELGLTYFIYQGGLIDDSRDFCAAHNGKVWSREETEEWKNWTPSKGEYPAGWEVKAKDMYSVPSYLNVPGYDPLINRGGYHCRHAIGWIADDIAFDMRKDLKK